MNSRLLYFLQPVVLALAAVLILLIILGTSQSVRAAPRLSARYVAISGSDTSDCTDPTQPCRTVQYAVDLAASGDQVRVAAGVYTDVHVRPRMDVSATGSVSQVVYITKSLSVEGGYSTDDDFSAAYPTVNLTTLNAQGVGRGIYVAGNISVTLAGMQIISGTAYHMGGSADGFDAGSGIYI